MKKLIAGILLLVASLAHASGLYTTATGNGTFANVTASGTVHGATVTSSGAVTASGVVTGAGVTDSRACAAGYTRVGPHDCNLTSWPNMTTMTIGACTALSPPSASATAITILTWAIAVTANATGARHAYINLFSDASCATAYGTSLGNYLASADGYEFSATTSQVVGETFQTQDRVLPSAGATLYAKTTTDAGNQSIGRFLIIGYHD